MEGKLLLKMTIKNACFSLCLLVFTSIFFSCSRPVLPYICDPAWSGPLSADSKEAVLGLGRSGYRVEKIIFSMAELPSGLNSLLVSRKEKLIALSPFLGSEISRLHAIFPDKTFVIPGLAVPDGLNAYGSRTDTAQAVELLGHIAAKTALNGGSGSKAGIFYAAAIFPVGPEGEAQKADFLRGFQAEITDTSREYLLVREVSEDKAEAVAAINDFVSYDVKFLFLSAGSSAQAALAAVPERGWTVAGMRLKELSGTHPSLAASVEDDWEALARRAMARSLAQTLSKKAEASDSVPARILRLQGDRFGLFSNFNR
jgi:hypothetical protein